MARDMAAEPADDAWPCAPVPSVPGDVWHWQLETMHVVSRVRSDLRARIAHPSVSSWSSRSWRPTRCATAGATSGHSWSPAPMAGCSI